MSLESSHNSGVGYVAPQDESLLLNPHDSSQVWDNLTRRVEAFIAAWETEPDPPSPKNFAPESPESIRLLTLVELLKVDLEYRHKRSINQKLEDYLTELPELASGGSLPCDLIYEEYHIRREHGDPVLPQEYFDRFPAQEEELRRLLGLEKPQLTTTLVTPVRPAETKVGDKLDDFDLLAKLGQGAFATVFLARQNSLQRMVALKVSANSGDEPQTLAQLDHPHIVRVYDQRLLPERGIRLLYMQYVSGGTLQSATEFVMQQPADERHGRALLTAVDRALDLRGDSPPATSSTRRELSRASWWETVCILGMQLASALDYAHRRGVLHRDLKPANILLSSEGAARLVDFNISFCSKLEGASPAAYFGGSLAYMSPEQLEACNPAHAREANTLDGRSDLYSLGVVLWEMLTGERPFQDDLSPANWSGTLASMAANRHAGPSAKAKAKLAAVCPESVQETLLWMLGPEVEDRPATGLEAAAQLRLCLRPEASRLLRPVRSGWKRWARKWSLAVLLLVIILPNAVAAVFNYLYNEPWQDPTYRHLFNNIAFVVNGVAFPLGIAIAIGVAYPLTKAMRLHTRAAPVDPALARRARHTCVTLGSYAAIIGIVEWSVSGLTYPVALNLFGVSMLWNDYLHFFSSLALCGLIAASYPFFAVTYLTMCVMYPALVKQTTIDPEELESLGRLHRLTWFYLAVAAAVPMFGVLLLVFLGGEENRVAILTLCAIGLVGAGGVFLLARRVQRDLATLAEATGANSDLMDASSDSIRSRFS